MNPYQIRQIDEQGNVLAEKEIEAHSYDAVLRHMRSVTTGAKRIEVFNQDGERAGEINVDYWRQKIRRRK